MKMRSFIISALLFGSGMCALIYQTVWLREFRMIFGGSTAASAAVLAVFMGGLGAGGLLLGKKVDKKVRPLRFYAHLELAIAISAALSPLFLWAARAAYLALGGSAVLGNFSATGLRLLLAALVLGVPTFLMGGTLPAAARAVETDADEGRGNLALVYGANTLGAVIGVLLSTFWLLEQLGNRSTLWVGCAANIFVALSALIVSRFLPSTVTSPSVFQPADTKACVAPLPLVLIAAAVAGFVFLLMELVWYRMMTPLLGGTTFTFGLILAVALFGIGLGGAAYACFGGQRRPTLGGFALTCAIEAFFVAMPFAIGDGMAVLALLLRPFSGLGFYGDIFAWTQLTAIVVLPTAIVAGVQFPLLIGLLGKGRKEVGSHTGLAYAFNTLGAIAGSLAGGFGLLPALSATGAWKFSVVILALLGGATLIFAYRMQARISSLLTPAGLIGAALLMTMTIGPTATWRQSPIGAGRADEQFITSRNKKEEWLRRVRRYMLFQEDGTESCLGVSARSGLTFLINGKSDGNAVDDAGTQVMSGLLGAILQPQAKRSLVVGLGTGSTAGWLADIPSMDRVDVVELERAVLKVAGLCAPVNQSVLSNPKIHVTIGDARETLLTTREHYDLIVSEPSNPYRAGVASLYTNEYYAAAAQRLQARGLFLQFVQAYEIDSATIRSIYATFCSVFPVVETWQTNQADLLFVGSREPIRYDAEALRKRISEPPFKLALSKVWRVTNLEGFLAHYVANDSFAKEFASSPPRGIVNTDDRNFIEFGFARTVGKVTGLKIPELREAAHRRGQDRPALTGGDVDWGRVDDQNVAIDIHLGLARPSPYSFLNDGQRRRLAAESAYVMGKLPEALNLWREQPRDAETLTEHAMMAEMLTSSNDPGALKHIEKVAESNRGEALMLLASLYSRQGRVSEAVAALESAYVSCRTDPWVMSGIFQNSFDVAHDLASRDPSGAFAKQLYHALEQPFSVYAADGSRRKTLALIAVLADNGGFSEYTRKAVASFEPHVPWDLQFLEVRRNCYQALGDPRAAKADRELSQFLTAQPQPLDSPR